MRTLTLGEGLEALLKRAAESRLVLLGEATHGTHEFYVLRAGHPGVGAAAAHLNAMNKHGAHPWQLSFSYGRALQAPALKAWSARRRTSRRRSTPSTSARS